MIYYYGNYYLYADQDKVGLLPLIDSQKGTLNF